MTKTTDIPTQTTPLPGLFDEARHLVIEELHRRLGEEGYTAIRESHGCVFRFIDAEGSRLTDLADRARLTKQAVGEVVDDLEGLGYQAVVEMAIFIGILAVGLLYAWRKGVLRWA